MSLDRCLPDLERKGELDVGRSKEARELYEELRRYYERAHDPETAAALASQKTVERLEAAAAHKKRNLIREMTRKQDALVKMRRFNGGDPAGIGPIDPRAGEALLGFDERAGHNDSVQARSTTIKGRAHAMIEEILYRHHANLIGNVRNRAELEDVVRELFKPGSTGNDNARELADAWSRAAEYLRGRYNEAGGQIGKLDHWGLPQSHSSKLVRAAGYQAWRDFITPLLDRGRMIDNMTGEPFTDASLEIALRDVFETIRTDGWSKIEPGTASGKMLANQKAEHRFLHFADGDAWLAYHNRFGGGNPFDAMMGHIEAMSRDTALMEILGPNPAAFMTWLKDTIQKSAELDVSPGSKALERARAGLPKIQRLYDEITGALRRPENEKLALRFSTVRSLQSATKLGSATLSAVPTDPAFGAITRRYNGLPAWKMVGGYAKMLNPLSAEDRKLAVRAGLIAEEWAHMTAAQHRVFAEEMGNEVSKRLAAGVLRASGLAAYTQAGRWAFGMEFLGHLTNLVGKSFDELDPRLARAMQRHGISPGDWDVIRNSPIEEHRGAGWLLPQNVEDQRAGGAADKLLQMIQTETDYAVPVPDVRTRALMNSVAPRGTWIGEIGRSAFLFKSFGISVLMMHGRRMLLQTPINRARYAAAFFIMTTLGGAIALELKELAKGKDLRDPRAEGEKAKKQGVPAWAGHAQFWGAATAQGGGWGIYGDFLGSSQNRFGGGFASTLAGPMVQSAQNFGDATVGEGFRAVTGKPTHPGADVVKLLKQETPGSSLWYTRLAFERLVADQLQEEIDPNHKKTWRAMSRRAKEKGQEFWWEPGETSPRRAPELAKGK
jgi:hypothetical protein